LILYNHEEHEDREDFYFTIIFLRVLGELRGDVSRNSRLG